MNEVGMSMEDVYEEMWTVVVIRTQLNGMADPVLGTGDTEVNQKQFLPLRNS